MPYSHLRLKTETQAQAQSKVSMKIQEEERKSQVLISMLKTTFQKQRKIFVLEVCDVGFCSKYIIIFSFIFIWRSCRLVMKSIFIM
jgi:hypothetical protein